MHIRSLPPELHSHIVTLACEDKLSPAEVSPTSALLLASSYWHTITRPFRFHSIRVSGSSSIAKLLSSIEGHSKRDRRVYHLSLTDVVGSKGVADDESLFRRNSNIARLLRLLSPSLYTLDVDLRNSWHGTSLLSLLWELHFPQLESLSIKGFYPFPTKPKKQPVLSEGRIEIASTSNFPRLERLSLDGVSNPSGLLTLSPLDGIFPCLEILEIRGLRSAVAFAREVTGAIRQGGEALKDEDLSSVKVTSAASLPRMLRCLTLVCIPQFSAGHSQRARALHAEMLDILGSLTSQNVPKTQFTLQVVVEDSDSRP